MIAVLALGLLAWAGGGKSAAAEKTIEAKATIAWDPAALTVAVGDVIEWKVGGGTHGVRITNWAAVKDNVEVVTVDGQEPFNAETGKTINDDGTSTAGKLLLRLKIKTVPPAPAEITYNCVVHGAVMKGKVTITAAKNPIPNVPMKTQDNKNVRFYDDLIKDKIVIVTVMYTQCETCERGTRNLVQLQKVLGDHLGKDVFIYSITLDPEHDTPEVLKAYAEKFGAKPGWTFLTGKEEDITAVRNKLGLTTLSPEARAKLGLPMLTDQNPDQKLHTGMIVIGYDAFHRWNKTSALSRPDQILQIIERMKPPSQTKQ